MDVLKIPKEDRFYSHITWEQRTQETISLKQKSTNHVHPLQSSSHPSLYFKTNLNLHSFYRLCVCEWAHIHAYMWMYACVHTCMGYT